MMTKLLLRLVSKRAGGDPASPRARAAYGRLGGATGIACNLLLFACKLAAGLISGSIAITADALNNLSDAGTSVVTLLGFKLAAKPPDREHPFGHGRMEYMSGFIVAGIIVVMGAELLRTSAGKLLHPEPAEAGPAAFAVLAASIFVKLWMGAFFRRLSRLTGSGALKAAARDSLNDVLATSGVLVSAVLMTVSPVNPDGWVGLLVACFIIYSGLRAAHEMLSPLLGEAPDPALVKELERRVLSYEEIVGVHDLVVHSYGPGIRFACLHAEVAADAQLRACHEVVDACEREVGRALGLELVIHVDPVAECDAETEALHRQVDEIVHTVDAQLRLHDFRIVKSGARTNLIFDVVTPYRFPLTANEVKAEVGKRVSRLNPHYHCVIRIDSGER